MRRRFVIPAALAAAGIALSGCVEVLPVARPAIPQSQEYTKSPLRAGDGAAFISDYTARLQKALDNDGKGLEDVQAGPILDRTKAEVLIAKADGDKLGTVGFDSVLAAGPASSDYPLWFIAFASSDDNNAGTQAMLATRGSANDEWIVQQGQFVDKDRVPKFATQDGKVARADSGYAEDFGKVVTDVKEYLDGTNADALKNYDLSGDGLKSFRDYVDTYAKDKKSFRNVGAECQPYTDIDFANYAIKTTAGGASFAEMRCRVTIEVPPAFNFNLPKQVVAITSGSKRGNHVEIETSVPLFIETTDGKTKISTSDWFPLSGKQTKTGGKSAD